MNISSVIVQTSGHGNSCPEESLSAIPGCEIALREGQKLIVTIEAENIAGATSVMKRIENTPGVLSVQLAYAYSEDELETEMQRVNAAPDFPGWLNEDSVRAGDIPYSGKLKM